MFLWGGGGVTIADKVQQKHEYKPRQIEQISSSQKISAKFAKKLRVKRNFHQWIAEKSGFR